MIVPELIWATAEYENSPTNKTARLFTLFSKAAVEVLLDKLLPTRQAVASAHRGNYGRSGGNAVIWPASRDVRLRQGQSSIPRYPQPPMLAAGRDAPECDRRLRCLCNVRP